MDHLANEISQQESLDHGRQLVARADQLARSSLLMLNNGVPAMPTKRGPGEIAAQIAAFAAENGHGATAARSTEVRSPTLASAPEPV